MDNKRPKVIYIGPQQVYDYLVNRNPQWDFEPCVPDIPSLWAGLESGKVDQESHIILVIDFFFDEKGQDTSFEQLIATMAPHCMIGIVNYKPHLRNLISERIDSEAYAMGSSEDVKYYFIDKQQPDESIKRAVAAFAAESPLEEIVSVITGRPIAQRVTETPAVVDVPPVRQLNPIELLEEDDDEENPYLGRVVTVTSSKGGSGKSTVALTLATYLAHASINSEKEGLEPKRLKIAVLDLDVRDGQIGFLTGNSKPTVIQLRTRGVSKKNIEEVAIYNPRLKLDVILAPKRPRNAEDLPPDFYVELIQTLRKMYDYVILDTSVNYLDPLLEKVAYPMSDQIIFVTDIVINSVFSMTRWILEVTKSKEQGGMGISKNKIAIVVNKALLGVGMPGEKIQKSAQNIYVIAAIPSNPKVMAHAANTQSMDLLLQYPDLYKHLRKIARAITGKRYKLSDNVS